jgi:hypothetical protein
MAAKAPGHQDSRRKVNPLIPESAKNVLRVILPQMNTVNILLKDKNQIFNS